MHLAYKFILNTWERPDH